MSTDSLFDSNNESKVSSGADIADTSSTFMSDNNTSFNENDDGGPPKLFTVSNYTFTPLSLTVLMSFILIFLASLVFAIWYVRRIYREESDAEFKCTSCRSTCILTSFAGLMSNKTNINRGRRSKERSGDHRNTDTAHQNYPEQIPTKTFLGESGKNNDDRNSSSSYYSESSSEVASSVIGKEIHFISKNAVSPSTQRQPPPTYSTPSTDRGIRYAGAFAIPEASEANYSDSKTVDSDCYNAPTNTSSTPPDVSTHYADTCMTRDTPASCGNQSRSRKLDFSNIWASLQSPDKEPYAANCMYSISKRVDSDCYSTPTNKTLTPPDKSTHDADITTRDTPASGGSQSRRRKLDFSNIWASIQSPNKEPYAPDIEGVSDV